MRSMYDLLTSEEHITMEWEGTVDDERLDVIREAFFGFFLNAFTEPTMPEMRTIDGFDVGNAGDQVKQSAQGGYKLKSCTTMQTERNFSRTIELKNVTLPIRRPIQLVSNLSNTYDRVKNNPSCVSSVNLNDPFFERRDINFIVDVEAMDIFEEEINYVTVNVRKKRSPGEEFRESASIKPADMREKGRLATITYARENDRNSDVYEYKTQWSLRGGEVYPKKPGLGAG